MNFNEQNVLNSIYDYIKFIIMEIYKHILSLDRKNLILIISEME